MYAYFFIFALLMNYTLSWENRPLLISNRAGPAAHVTDVNDVSHIAYCSHDVGATYVTVSAQGVIGKPVQLGESRCQSVDISIDKSGNHLFILYVYYNNIGVIESTDGGKTWAKPSSVLSSQLQTEAKLVHVEELGITTIFYGCCYHNVAYASRHSNGDWVQDGMLPVWLSELVGLSVDYTVSNDDEVIYHVLFTNGSYVLEYMQTTSKNMNAWKFIPLGFASSDGHINYVKIIADQSNSKGIFVSYSRDANYPLTVVNSTDGGVTFSKSDIVNDIPVNFPDMVFRSGDTVGLKSGIDVVYDDEKGAIGFLSFQEKWSVGQSPSGDTLNATHARLGSGSKLQTVTFSAFQHATDSTSVFWNYQKSV